jgi:hypothetical protein
MSNVASGSNDVCRRWLCLSEIRGFDFFARHGVVGFMMYGKHPKKYYKTQKRDGYHEVNKFAKPKEK